MAEGINYSIVSPLIEAYAEQHTSPEPEILIRLSRDTHLRTHTPQMLSGHLQGTFLRMISHLLQPSLVLEIGTFTGYSAICLASGLKDNGLLHTIDLNPEMKDFAVPYFQEARLDQKIIMHTGDAIEIIKKLPGHFDLVFIDADKENYIAYFELVLDKIRPGGWILADNTLWYGKVLNDDQSGDSETTGISSFNKYVQNHPGVENVLIPIRDGLMLIRKL